MTSARRTMQFCWGASLVLLFSSCSKSEAPEQTQPAAKLAAKPVAKAPAKAVVTKKAASGPALEAKKVFAQKCVVCHGTSGDGDGPGSAALQPKPRAFKDPNWQKGVTDEHLRTVILKGGMAVGKSPIMPGNPELKGKPKVIEELVKIVRGFKS